MHGDITTCKLYEPTCIVEHIHLCFDVCVITHFDNAHVIFHSFLFLIVLFVR